MSRGSRRSRRIGILTAHVQDVRIPVRREPMLVESGVQSVQRYYFQGRTRLKTKSKLNFFVKGLPKMVKRLSTDVTTLTVTM